MNRRFFPLALAAILTTATAGSGCLLLPQIVDRIVELAVGGATVVPFTASGSINVYDDSKTIDFQDRINIAQILSDAGLDAAKVKKVRLSAVSYRVTQPDPEPTRQITGGTITVRRGLGTPKALVSNFSVMVNSATSWQPATLQGAGVTEVNGLLADILAALKGTGPPVAARDLTFHVQGTSNPAGVPTNFQWELRVEISIVGEVTVKVVE